MSDDDITVPLGPFADWALRLAREYDDWDIHVPEDCEYDLTDVEWHHGDIDTEDGETVIEFGGTLTGKTYKQVLSARYNPPGKAHPAEYEAIEHELFVTVRFYPERGLGDFKTTLSL